MKTTSGMGIYKDMFFLNRLKKSCFVLVSYFILVKMTEGIIYLYKQINQKQPFFSKYFDIFKMAKIIFQISENCPICPFVLRKRRELFILL